MGGSDPGDRTDDAGDSSAESRLADAVSVESVTVEAPEAPSVRTFDEKEGTADEDLEGSMAEIHPELLRLFVASVVALNLALLAASLGVMVWYFEGMDRLGGGLVLVGAIAGFRTYQYYREYDSRDWDREEDPAADGGGP